MKKLPFIITAIITLHALVVTAQTINNIKIPISKADLGTFPYFKTLPNYEARNSSDSITFNSNRGYFFDGKNYFSVDGKMSVQVLQGKYNNVKPISEFEFIQTFDKIITALGGIKFYAGKLNTNGLELFAGNKISNLIVNTKQVAADCYNGVVEYVIKTPEKEVWIQLVPYVLASGRYSMMLVEKSTSLTPLNTNKRNQVLEELDKSKKSTLHLLFEPDNAVLLPESKDELLNILGVFQAHPDWKMKIACYTALVGNEKYDLPLSDKRASAIKQELINLGVNQTSIDAKGMGNQNPLASNDTELGRLTNTRIEIVAM